MKSFSETLLVVHINDFNAELFSRLFQTRFINSGSCGGEQTPFALYLPIIKNCPKRTIAFTSTPMCLVCNDQIKMRSIIIFLRLSDQRRRLIC